MIVITEKRRLELTEHAEEIKDRLSEYGYPFQPFKTKQLLEIALTTLSGSQMAQSVTFIDPHEFLKQWNNDVDCPLAGLGAKSALIKTLTAYVQEVKRANGMEE